MSLPAGWLATRLGYRGGIIAGLLMVAVGGFWFIPATKIAAFWAFLLGVCVVASGLTFLETVANPYTTVLGAPTYAASRINLAQSCNGVGWVFGPIAGSHIFLRQGCLGQEHRERDTLDSLCRGGSGGWSWLRFSSLPRCPTSRPRTTTALKGKRRMPAKAQLLPSGTVNRLLSWFLLLGNVCALLCVFGMILWLSLGSLGVGPKLVGFAEVAAASFGHGHYA